MDNIGLLKQILCKHKWVESISIIIGLAFPFALNCLVMQHTSYSVAGKPETWIAFWPSYLSAIASFGMIVLTAITLLFNNEILKNNKEQLDEMKRQWDKEHKPDISISYNMIDNVSYDFYSIGDDIVWRKIIDAIKKNQK